MTKPSCFGKQFGNDVCYHTCMHSDACYREAPLLDPVGPIQLIGIAGPARSGKDTAASYLMRALGWPVKHFADPLKEMLRVGFGFTEAQLYGDEKEIVDTRYGHSPRHFMQTLGTQWGREQISPTIWSAAMENSLRGPSIIADVRFEDETALIRKYGTLIHIKGRGGIQGSHASEQGIEVSTQDFVIFNGGGIEELYRHLDAWLATV